MAFYGRGPSQPRDKGKLKETVQEEAKANSKGRHRNKRDEEGDEDSDTTTTKIDGVMPAIDEKFQAKSLDLGETEVLGLKHLHINRKKDLFMVTRSRVFVFFLRRCGLLVVGSGHGTSRTA